MNRSCIFTAFYCLRVELLVLMIGVFLWVFSNTFCLFSDFSRLIDSRLQIQPSVPCPGDQGIAAFSVDWVGENN